MSTVLQVLVAGVLALGGWGAWWGGAVHGRAGTDAPPGAGGTCLEGTVDCIDDPSNGGGAAGGTCLEGTVDCIDDPSYGGGTADPGTGMCAPGYPDCVDVVVDPDGEVDCGADGCDPEDEFDQEHERQEAKALLGVAEDDLDPEVRIARRGDEQYALTEDYRLGRDTVELDADTEGVHRVVLVTVELMDGPETYTAG